MAKEEQKEIVSVQLQFIVRVSVCTIIILTFYIIILVLLAPRQPMASLQTQTCPCHLKELVLVVCLLSQRALASVASEKYQELPLDYRHQRCLSSLQTVVANLLSDLANCPKDLQHYSPPFLDLLKRNNVKDSLVRLI